MQKDRWRRRAGHPRVTTKGNARRGRIHSGGIQRSNIFPKWRGGFYAEAKGKAYEYFIMFALDSSVAAGIDCILRVRKPLPGQCLEILCLS